MKRAKQERSNGIFLKVALVYSLVLLLVLIFVELVINHFCVTFIKEQRMKYNTQILDKAAYEMKDFYSRIDSLLVRLCNEDRFAKTKMQLVVEGESAFERIKREVDFVDDVKDATYANGLGAYYSGILFFDERDDYYYIGSGVIQPEYSFGPLEEQVDAGKKKQVLTILGPMEEAYKKNSDPRKQVFGFARKTNPDIQEASGESGLNDQYVMIIIDQDEIIGILKDIFLNEKGFFIRDRNKEIFYQSGMEEIGIHPEELQTRSGSTETAGKNVLVTSVFLESYGWELSVVDEEKVLFEDVNRLMNRVTVFIVAGSVISMFLFLLITRKVLFPISMLKNMIRQVTVDNDTYLEVMSNDEAGEISRLINKMKKQIKGLTDNQYLLEMKTTEARLQVLQSQINPHFLYNTLDNIYCIAQIEEIEPITVLTRNLSEMLRYGIDNKKMFVILSEEIDYVRAYLNIINIRYEDRISLEVEIDEQINDCQVFKLLLQPLVENACVHGILPSQLEQGRIIIRGIKVDQDVILEVRNSGVRISDQRLQELNDSFRHPTGEVRTDQTGFGIALGNINERLKIFYGAAYGMEISAVERWGTSVKIRQQYRRREDPT